MKRRSKKRLNWMMLVSGGLLVVWLLRRNWLQKGVFPQLHIIQKRLAEKYGEVEAAFFVGKLQQRYEVLYSERPRFSDRKLQTHVDELIIPILALYQGLIEKTGDAERSLVEVHELMTRVVSGKSQKIIPLLQYFSDPFSMMRRAVRLVNKTVFPASGWDIEYIQDDTEAIAFNIHKCLFMNIFTAYGVPELTKVLCQFDDDIAELFPPQILWQRRSTLARGAELCDFRYLRGIEEKQGLE